MPAELKSLLASVQELHEFNMKARLHFFFTQA
jgi:hypothetical protein